MTGAAAGWPHRFLHAWKSWIGFGRQVADFQSRIVLAWIYFTLVAPLGLLVSWISDPLRTRTGRAPSYWVARPQVDLAEDARQQF